MRDYGPPPPVATLPGKSKFLPKAKPQGPCHYCEKVATAWDHVVPQSMGGSHEPWNLVAACGSCNSGKGGWWTLCECDYCAEAIGRNIRGPYGDHVLRTVMESMDRTARSIQSYEATLDRQRRRLAAMRRALDRWG